VEEEDPVRALEFIVLVGGTTNDTSEAAVLALVIPDADDLENTAISLGVGCEELAAVRAWAESARAGQWLDFSEGWVFAVERESRTQSYPAVAPAPTKH